MNVHVREGRGRRLGEARDFRRFVERLGHDDLVIRHIWFVMSGWRGMHDIDMERLFGQVLPCHRTLRSLEIVPGPGSSPFVRLLTESIPETRTTPLRKLSFDISSVNHEEAEAIAAMVDRNVDLEELDLSVEAQEDGRRICHAVAGNTYIRKFEIYMEHQIWADALESVASSSSSLRELHVRGYCPSRDGVANMANQLRTNTTLTCLILAVDTDLIGPYQLSYDELFQPLLDVLETYNFTLLTVTVNERYSRWSGQPRAAELLRRNRRVQSALAQLEPWNYRVEPIELAPRVLEMVRNLPTLLYRFIRRGNVNRLFAVEQSSVGGGRKRGRPRGNDSDGSDIE